MTKSREVRDQLLEELRAGLTITDACAQVGITRVTYYAWLEDPEWSLEVDAARTFPRAQMTNVMIQAALAGDWRPAHAYLKSVAPDEWSERREVELNVNNSGSDGAALVQDMIAQLRTDLESSTESTDDEHADADD